MTPTRREALRLAAASLMLGFSAGRPVQAQGGAGRSTMLGAYVDVLLPGDGMTPSASALAVHEGIMDIAADVEPLARLINLMGDWLDGSGRGAFAALNLADRETLVAHCAAADPDTPEGRFHLLIRLFAIEFYYAAPEALAGFDLAPAPQPMGYPPPWG